ncbi:hypothetical protein [Thermococcus thermotolerans]|uniref:hypothetical protein n=1 Tax=Thermococcus thermotolerans TaxID=2969672 RepID=UPI002157A4B7|nr:hypothetical protein [Thermococcus thermotolerans]
MQVKFERLIPLDDDGVKKMEGFLAELRFVHHVRGPNEEIWGYSPKYIKERYETYFYLVDFAGESFLIASTVPLKIPVPGRRVLKLRGDRNSIARRLKLHFLDPLNRRVNLQRTAGLDVTSLLALTALGGILLWLNPYLFALTLLILLLGLTPGSAKIITRHGREIVIFKRNGRTYKAASLLAGMVYLVPLIKTFQDMYRSAGDIRVLAALLLVSTPMIILALMILYFQREWRDLV